MGKVYEHIDDKLTTFIKAQKVFFVATAPLAGDGHVNLSPKGYDSFAVLGPSKVAWLDIGGSGIETMAHVKENGRMTIMFCAFDGSALILRLYGECTSVQFDDPAFPAHLAHFPAFDKARAIYTMDVTRIQDSCGWGVPFYDFREARDQLMRFADNPKMTADKWAEVYYSKNAMSIDGLVGMERQK